ncbi:gluconokinase [Salinifilum ghardaiensis]
MSALASATDVVLGIDAGTTAVKIVVTARDARMLHRLEREYPLYSDDSGAAVHDADEVRETVIAALVDGVRWAQQQGCAVAALSFSTAMHTLVGVDGSGSAVTPAFTWGDSRAQDVAARLREDPRSRQLHRETGTPVHTQSVMVKLAWLTEQRPDLARAASRWCALKDYVVGALVDDFVTDFSLNSGSGLQDMRTRDWHAPALSVAGVRAEQLPRIAAPTDVLGLSRSAASRVGLPSGTPVVLGGGDGPLANLGVGAVRPGAAAVSLGTSGALRVVSGVGSVDERCRTFSYALTEDMWVLGGAVSNGAVVGQWAAETFGVEMSAVLDEALAVQPGADGLVALPYLLGERAPWWRSGLTGALLGLRRSHGRAEITRAVIEGVAQQLALVRDAVVDSGARVDAVRATGGGFRSEVWRSTVAAALGCDLQLPGSSGGSGVGAALLAWYALGELSTLDSAADLVRVEETAEADPSSAEFYERHRPRVEALHEALLGLHGS